MQLKQLLNDDDAVSPVIGVILMVAITVILAAVIGTFVLGLGDQVQETSPNSQWTWEESSASGSGQGDTQLTLKHQGGQSVTPSNLGMTVNAEHVNHPAGTHDITSTSSSVWTGLNGNSDIVAGASFEVADGANGNYFVTGDTVTITWASDGGSSSATLTEHEVS